MALDADVPEAPVAPAQDERLALRDLQAALDRLPAEQKEVLLLVALEDMAYADVARTLGIPIGTVMSRARESRDMSVPIGMPSVRGTSA